jgi:ATP-dependent DNA ligase
LSRRPLAERRHDQLTKASDYGAALVAITVAQFYLSGMLQHTLPAGFIAPCLPTKTDKLPAGSQWLHEIKHDGFRVIARKNGERVSLYSRPGNDLTRRFPLIVETLARLTPALLHHRRGSCRLR